MKNDEKTGRLSRIVDFCRLADKEKFIRRRTYLTDGERFENDAEHAWHLAVMALLLSEYAEEEVDVLKVMSIVLIHDLIEIYAGDTFAYDTEGLKTQKERENAAADRLFSLCFAYTGFLDISFHFYKTENSLDCFNIIAIGDVCRIPV